MQTFEMKTPYGTVTATWHRKGKMIVVRYGDREKQAQASETDATNQFVARDIVRDWIRRDLAEPAT